MKASGELTGNRVPHTFEVRPCENGWGQPGERELAITHGQNTNVERLTAPELADLARVAHDAAYTGRKHMTWAFGNTPAEIEHAAVLAARDFFGPKPGLAADPHWTAEQVTGSIRRLHDVPPEARHGAQVIVRELA